MSAWLFTILHNHFRSEFRKRRREVEDADGSHLASLKSAPEQHSRLEFKELLAALAKLPLEQREALLLVGASGFSYDDAAAICDTAVGTIKSRVNRARKVLAELLELGSADQVRPRKTTAPSENRLEQDPVMRGAGAPPSEAAAAPAYLGQLLSIRSVTAQNAIHHSADKGNAVAGASTVAVARAIAITIAGAAVVDWPADVAAAVAGSMTVSGDMTAAVAGNMSATAARSCHMSAASMSMGG